VRGLEKIFSPVVVYAMSDTEVEAIASEPLSAKRQRELLASGQAAAQALWAYLSRGLCWDDYLMRTTSFYRPVTTREQVWLREAAFKARKIGGLDACAKH
jgi:hypothetical protein